MKGSKKIKRSALRRMMNKKSFRIFLGAIALVLLVWASKGFLRNVAAGGGKEIYNKAVTGSKLKRAQDNYGQEVWKLSQQFDLSYPYLMSLLTLECSGTKPAGSRFEKKVFAALKNVKSGKRKKYESVKTKHLKDASEDALRNLATSWGPFQLMGYKCIGMEVQVQDIRGRNATLNGIKWIEEEYGRLVKKEKWKDAFHYHNTGRKFPRNGVPTTHDPLYVTRGLEYIEYFSTHKPG